MTDHDRDREIARIEWTDHRREHEQMQVALDTARGEVNRRLAEMNELRGQIDRERGAYMTRAEYEAKHEAVITQINDLQRARSNLEGRMWAIGAVLVIIELALRYLPIGPR